ncbi:hypothetical protein AAVH_37048, partial [Aphelenchoides avenae]
VVPAIAGSVYIVSAAVSDVLSVAAALKYRQLVKEGVIQLQSNQDGRLLVHTVYMLLVQCLRVSYYIIIFVATSNGDTRLHGTAQLYFAAVVDLYSLSGSPFLFLISSDVRRVYLKFYGLTWLKRRTSDSVNVAKVGSSILSCT